MSKLIALRGKRGEGKFAIVDDEDFEELSKYRWYINNHGYVVRSDKNGVFLIHREILRLQKGDKKHVDHINHNSLDERKVNLRICTMTENTRNTRPRGGSSKYKGIYLENKLWGVRIQNDWLGTYYTEYDAALAYDQEARKRYGEFAYLNFPEITDYSKLIQFADNRYSKYKGVTFNKTHRKWQASFYNKKSIHIGVFNTEQEAYFAREEYIASLEKDKSIVVRI